MKSHEAQQQASQRAFEAELQKYANNDDITPLLTFLAESLEEEVAEEKRRIGAKVVLVVLSLFIYYLLLDYSCDGIRTQAVVIILAVLYYALRQPNASPRYPLLINAATETLLLPRNYSATQKALIARIANGTPGDYSAAQTLQEACSHALDRSV